MIEIAKVRTSTGFFIVDYQFLNIVYRVWYNQMLECVSRAGVWCLNVPKVR